MNKIIIYNNITQATRCPYSTLLEANLIAYKTGRYKYHLLKSRYSKHNIEVTKKELVKLISQSIME